MKRIALLLVVVFVAAWPAGQAEAQANVGLCPVESTFILRPGETFAINVPAFSALRIGQENTGAVVAQRAPGGPIAIQPGRSLYVNDSPATDVRPFTNTSTTQFIAVYACTLPLASTPTPTRTPTNTPTSSPIPTTTPIPVVQCFSLPLNIETQFDSNIRDAFGAVDWTGTPVGSPVSSVQLGGATWSSQAGWPIGASGLGGWWIRNILSVTGGLVYNNASFSMSISSNFVRIPSNDPIGFLYNSNVISLSGSSAVELCPPNYMPPGTVSYNTTTLCYSFTSTPNVRYVQQGVLTNPTVRHAVVWPDLDAVFQTNTHVANGTMWLPRNFQGWTVTRTSGSSGIGILDNSTLIGSTSSTTTINVATQYLAIVSEQAFTGTLCIGSAPTPTPTRTATALPNTATPTRTATTTATAYPTPAANCVLVSVPAAGGTVTAQHPPGYVYAQNGIARVESTATGQTVFVDQTPQIYDGDQVAIERVTVYNPLDTILRVLFCTGTPTPTPIATGTAPALPCPIAESITIPPAPGVVQVTLSVGMRFVVAGAPMFVNIGAEAREIRPGNYSWNLAPGTFDAYTVTVQAVMYICVEAQPTPTGTNEPTPTARPLDEVCVPGATPAPAQTGQIPRLSLIIPTLETFPTRTATATAAVTITASLVISPAQTLVAVIIEPVQTVTAWCRVTFSGGWGEGQAEAQQYINDPVARAFGWLWLFDYIGPLSWLLPPVLITVFIRVIRPVISLVKYVKQILPFQ